jgi:uncharacterized membrane protein
MRLPERNDLDALLLHIIRTERPDTVEQLVQTVHHERQIAEEVILNRIKDLEKRGRVQITANPPSYRALWYWITLALALSTVTVVFTVPEAMPSPLLYVRYLLGSIFTLFLPGYTVTKALFPEHVLDNLEHVVVSVGASIGLVPILVFLLNFTPWGITVTSIITALLLASVAFGTVGVLREAAVRAKRSNVASLAQSR